jgi:hypothetical protein
VVALPLTKLAADLAGTEVIVPTPGVEIEL